MIEKKITDNNIENWVLIEAYKNLFAELPKEESQMFYGKEFEFYSNNTEKKFKGVNNTQEVIERVSVEQPLDNIKVNQIRINSPISETDYAGIINNKVKVLIENNLCNITYFKEGDWNINNLFESNNTTKFRLINDMQFLNIPIGVFKKENIIENSDDEEFINDFGTFYIKIEPYFIETTIDIVNKKEHLFYNKDDLELIVFEEGNRRNIYEIDIEPFKNTPLNFESIGTNKIAWSNRLLGSIVYNKKSNGLNNNIKIITNDYFDFINNKAFICLSPDYMGVDNLNNRFYEGNTIKIYPNECYFEPIVIKIDFSKEIFENEQIKKFLLNDAVRDFENNIIEIYDDNGIAVEDNGQISGRVYSSFQVIEQQGKEIRKKLL